MAALGSRVLRAAGAIVGVRTTPPAASGLGTVGASVSQARRDVVVLAEAAALSRPGEAARGGAARLLVAAAALALLSSAAAASASASAAAIAAVAGAVVLGGPHVPARRRLVAVVGAARRDAGLRAGADHALARPDAEEAAAPLLEDLVPEILAAHAERAGRLLKRLDEVASLELSRW
jgi:hypothetical protein